MGRVTHSIDGISSYENPKCDECGGWMEECGWWSSDNVIWHPDWACPKGHEQEWEREWRERERAM